MCRPFRPGKLFMIGIGPICAFGASGPGIAMNNGCTADVRAIYARRVKAALDGRECSANAVDAPVKKERPAFAMPCPLGKQTRR